MSDAERFAARGFGLTIGFGERPALLIVDLINAFTDPDQPLGSDLDAVVAATATLLDEARAARVPVLYTTTGYESETLADAGIWALKHRGNASLRAGTPGVEIDARVAARPEDGVIAKKYASAFFGTDLVSRLTSTGVDTLIIAGATTSGCVRASAVDALQHGFRPMVVREAVGDRSEAAHDQSLFDLQQKYADVVTLEETLAYLRGRAADLSADRTA